VSRLISFCNNLIFTNTNGHAESFVLSVVAVVTAIFMEIAETFGRANAMQIMFLYSLYCRLIYKLPFLLFFFFFFFFLY